jgi:phosphate transport system substrate-binding protein
MIARTFLGEAVLAIALSAGGSAALGAEIHGAGATFPAPLYAAWSAEYERQSGIKVSYEAVGSGAGLDRIRQHTVDFGASDAPLTAQQLVADDLLEFPVIIGGVVPVINISGISSGELRLTGELLADIYLGVIRKWNDARIADLNPHLPLPAARITVVHRVEPSGSSLLWSEYLSRSSGAWRAQVGASLTPQWPTGVGGVGNEGVASYVQRTRFSIGYVEHHYSRMHNLSDVALRNQSGHFVRAGRDAFHSAAEATNWGSTPTAQLPIDAPGAGSWPITAASFILITKGSAPQSGGVVGAAEVVKFFKWSVLQGEPIARKLGYAPLPKRVADELPALWAVPGSESH